MQIFIPKETKPGEKRVAATPETIKKMVNAGIDVTVESGAGLHASFSDQAYQDAGAKLGENFSADLVMCVQPLSTAQIEKMKAEAMIVGLADPYQGKERMQKAAAQKVTMTAMEFMPRITRAQSMDVLSSQSNLAGYRAVIEAATTFNRAMPMMMTAAGTVAPARVLILGAGVAGLQAIATAKRLGAIVSAFDVRPAVKEQVESLGAKFVEVPASEDEQNAETKGGYAKEMSEDYKKRQAELIFDTVKGSDIVITTALIPGKPAPKLISEAMVKAMPQGGVIVDLAAIQGGNCDLTKADEIVAYDGKTILGPTNLPSHIARDASNLYAKNLWNLLDLLFDKESKKINLSFEDEIVQHITLTHQGKIIHPQFKEEKAA